VKETYTDNDLDDAPAAKDVQSSNTKDCTLLSFNHGIRDYSNDAVGALKPDFKCSFKTLSPDSIPD